MKQPSSSRKFLLPLVPAYRLALLLRELGLRAGAEPVNRLRSPVVSIGSLSAGGAGKTPLTIALARALDRRGLRIDVLSRGYGRHGLRPARVDPEGCAQDFGDEPLLIARETGVPVYVAGQRYGAGQLAEAEAPQDDGVTLHLLDDGFQHRQLYRDVDILLIDRRDWHQDRLLPAGNLREPIKAARRATVIAIPAPDGARELEAALRSWGWEGPVWKLHRKMEVPALGVPVAAFCGIARPEQFFSGLQAAGLSVAVRLPFRDHHRYTPADLSRIATTAQQSGASAFITTEKDLVRLGKLSSALPESLPLKTARLRIEVENGSAAIDWLVGRLVRRSEE